LTIDLYIKPKFLETNISGVITPIDHPAKNLDGMAEIIDWGTVCNRWQKAISEKYYYP